MHREVKKLADESGNNGSCHFRNNSFDLALWQLKNIVKAIGTEIATAKFGHVKLSLFDEGAVVATSESVFTIYSSDLGGAKIGAVGALEATALFDIIADILLEHRLDTSSTIPPLRYASGEALQRALAEGTSRIPKALTTRVNNDVLTGKFGALEDKRFICCLDLELTCWEQFQGAKKQDQKQEIIEIGVVVLDTRQSYLSVERVSQTIRPVVRPTLSQFCISLTGIVQADVDNSPDLASAMTQLLQKLPNVRDFVWASWGNDPNLLNQEMEIQNLSTSNVLPFSDPRFIDVSLCTRAQFDGKINGQASALRHLRLPSEPPAHRALPDAISLSRIVQTMQFTPMDALVSESCSYRDLLNARRRSIAATVAKSLNGDIQRAERLLELLAWNPVRVRQVLSLLRHNSIETD